MIKFIHSNLDFQYKENSCINIIDIKPVDTAQIAEVRRRKSFCFEHLALRQSKTVKIFERRIWPYVENGNKRNAAVEFVANIPVRELN